MVLSFRKCVGRNLKALRLYSRLSQAEMAEAINLSRSMYMQCETGNRALDTDDIYNLSAYFNINYDLIFEEDADIFLSRLAANEPIEQKGRDLIDTYKQLSLFSKGRLVQFAQELLNSDLSKIQQANK